MFRGDSIVFKDWNFWLSIVTVIVAVTALIQSHLQIKLSNKQHLFDKRVEIHLIAMGLLQLFRNNKSYLENTINNDPIHVIDFMFSSMTNNTYLEHITPAIKNPLNEPYHKEFLVKMETIKEVGSKIEFLFSGKASELLADFVLDYQQFLFALYQYQILYNNIVKITNENEMSLKKARQMVKENGYRENLKVVYNKLRQAFILLEKERVEDKIKMQIKL